MNPFYNGLVNGFSMPQPAPSPQYNIPQASNPIQQANMIMQAMRDPAGFVRSMVPDLPPEISHDPNKILQYLQQTRGFTNEQIQQAAVSIPRF